MRHDTWLVTGASGFIGKFVVQTLCATTPGSRIIIAGRREVAIRERGVEYFGLDLLSPSLELPEDIDGVIHLAGNKQDVARMQAINHHGTRRLVEAAERVGVRRFIYVSSVGVYGAPPHSGVITESFPHTPRNPYEISKDEGEACVQEVCGRGGMEHIILQPSNVIGIVSGSSNPLLGLMRTIQRGWLTWFGPGDVWVNYVAVEDVAAAVVDAAGKAPSGQTFIINTPERLSHITRWIAEELGVPLPRRRLPLWVGQVTACLGSTVSRVVGRSMPINHERLLELTNTTRYDGSALMKATGFAYPMGIESAIRNLARQYVQKGLL
jgi:nucleoside-diphosphate-sugar epimerase